MRLYLFRDDTTFVEVVQPVVIGRAIDCDLVLPSNRVSRQYAKVERVGDDFFIEDLGSSSGIFLRRQRIGRHRVQHGDEFSLGTVRVTAMLREDELETPLIRAAADEAAAHPNDRARRAVWSDLMLERADPLGSWLVSTQAFPQVTTGAGVALVWDDRLIRTAVVRHARAGHEMLTSRLACHLVELAVELEDDAQAPAADAFLRRLVATPLPALKIVRLRDLEFLRALPLAPRLVSLQS